MHELAYTLINDPGAIGAAVSAIIDDPSLLPEAMWAPFDERIQAGDYAGAGGYAIIGALDIILGAKGTVGAARAGLDATSSIVDILRRGGTNGTPDSPNPGTRPGATDAEAGDPNGFAHGGVEGGVGSGTNNVLTNVDFPDVNRQISVQRQSRHIEGSIDPRTGQPTTGSVMRSQSDAQQVLDAYHSGNTTVIGQTQQGFPVVRYDGVTGINNNPGAGFVNQQTNIFIVKVTSSPSIVPTNPNWGQ